ncbi:hypothetical protein RHGRI_017247 [Rhododendron griersonianum]|uniref:Uncharacterized protein n=1 Tax=Rhododendron griersonianum TaxID=479676 RepID=A0AAV6JX29_9ERIC|nr:hypothetical protein RHGRI_017247 [Rhododendron griersonianum]KAG5544732.1 hypothetical protein RHGRI_017247 [Rhododendron griersonianum]KAG5544733.1 hypothetical protein RHGRI_017247 [Rhododendron griersonianum]
MSRSPLPLLPTLPASVVDLMIRRICRRATPRAAGRRGTAGARKARTQGTGNLSPSKRSAVSISPSPVGSPECRQDSEESEHVSKRKLEEHMKVDDIMMLKDLPMRDFETKVWDAVGKDFINKEDRIQGAEFQVFSSQNRRFIVLLLWLAKLKMDWFCSCCLSIAASLCQNYQSAKGGFNVNLRYSINTSRTLD